MLLLSNVPYDGAIPFQYLHNNCIFDVHDETISTISGISFSLLMNMSA